MSGAILTFAHLGLHLLSLNVMDVHSAAGNLTPFMKLPVLEKPTPALFILFPRPNPVASLHTLQEETE